MVAKQTEIGRDKTLCHKLVYRQRCAFRSIDARDGFRAQRLMIKSDTSTSLLSRRCRAGHWLVLRGRVEVTRDDVYRLEVAEITSVPLDVTHRMHNPWTEPLEVVEVQTGSYFDEVDIERLGDVDKQAAAG